MKLALALAGALPLMSGAASADATQTVIDGLKAAGFQRIEIQRSPTTLKVEAIRGSEKLEQIIDRATGEVLKQETEALAPGERLGDVLTVRDRDRSGNDDDDDGDRSGRGGGDDDDDLGDDDDGGDRGDNSGPGGDDD